MPTTITISRLHIALLTVPALLVIAGGLYIENSYGNRPLAGNVAYCLSSPAEQREIFAQMKGDIPPTKVSRNMLQMLRISMLAGSKDHFSSRIAVQDSTLTIFGELSPGIAKYVKHLIQTNNIKRIRINSWGGSLPDGREIGRTIRTRGIDLEVDGLCISSCAIGIATMAPSVELNGVIGFHGSSQACLEDQSIISLLINLGFKKAITMWLDARQDERFLRNRPTVATLGRVTAPSDRGFNDGVNAEAYLPSLDYLRGAGINITSGKLDLNLVESLNTIERARGVRLFKLGPHPMIPATNHLHPSARQKT